MTRLADAMDAGRRQAVPTLPDVQTPAHILAVEFLATFDRCLHVPGLGVTLFEHHSPGAATAFRVWAAAHGVAIEERDLSGGSHVVSTTVGSKYDIAVHYRAAEVTP